MWCINKRKLGKEKNSRKTNQEALGEVWGKGWGFSSATQMPAWQVQGIRFNFQYKEEEDRAGGGKEGEEERR